MKQNVQQLAPWLSPTSHLPQSDIEWNDFVEAIAAAGLGGLALSLPSFPQSPAWVRHSLRASASAVGTSNLALLQELARIANAFGRARIPLMALKGAALSLTVYDARELRPMSDLDLLVHPDDAARAVKCLQAIGYQSGDSLIRDDFFPRFYYEREMVLHHPNNVRVDLHAHPWRPMHLAQAVQTEQFWNGATKVGCGEAEILVPQPATMLVHLAAHAAFHGCERYIWLYDLKKLAEHSGEGLDWNVVVERATRWHLGLAVHCALVKARSLLGPFCPQTIIHRLATAPSSYRDRLTLWHTPRDAASPLLHVFCNILCLRGLRSRASYLAAILVPDSGHLSSLYRNRHAGWTWCAHGVRALRAALRLCEAPLGFLRHAFQLSRA